MRKNPAEVPHLRHPCVAETCCVDVPQTHSHSFQGFTHGRKLQEGVPAPAPGPAASRRDEARPMPSLPPLPAGAPEPGAAAGAQVWTRSYETCQMDLLLWIFTDYFQRDAACCVCKSRKASCSAC